MIASFTISMPKTITVVLLLLISPVTIVKGQGGFNKAISFPDHKGLNFDDILIEDDGIVVAGNIYIDSLELWGLFIGKMDTLGIMLWHSSFTDPEGTSHIIQNTPTRFIRSSDSSYVIPVKVANRGNIGLVKIDSNGKLIYFKEYKTLDPYIRANAIVESCGSYYISGWINRLNLGTDYFLLKTDLLGEIIWTKYYGTPELEELSVGLISEEDSLISIGGVIYPPNINELGFEGKWYKPWILTVNSNGETMFDWKGVPNDDRTTSAAGCVHAPNGDWGFIYNEFKLVKVDFTDRIYSVPAISVLDSNFILKWKSTYGEYNYPLNTFYDLNYDSIHREWIAVGQVARNNGITGVIVKYSKEGELLWSSENYLYNNSSINARHYIGGVALSEAGTIYAAGHVEYTNLPYYDYGWILKITSDGCVDTLCTTTSIAEQLHHIKELSISPNPADDFITIKSKTEIASCELTNISGTVVKVENHIDGSDYRIDVSTLVPGMYILQAVTTDYQITSSKFIIVR